MPKFYDLEQWLRWQETSHPSEIDLGLERVRQVAGRLGLLEPQAKVITIAGTNGKGSCARALEAMLLASQKKVGVYSSPHIERYNERIKLNGQLSSDEQLINAFNAIDDAREQISLTYFEFGTLAAFYCMAAEQCEYWVIEVGLGGRLDATNVIAPDIAVITSIGLDHCDWLGPTREDIGREKAGICRAQKPLVCAECDVPQSIKEIVQNLACPSYWIDQNFSETKGEYRVGAKRLTISTQLAAPSVAAALQVMTLLKVGNEESWAEALAQASLPGRMELVNYNQHQIYLDVAHNPAAFQFGLQRLKELSSGLGCVVVLAMMKDKDILACVEILRDCAALWILAPLEHNSRAESPQNMTQYFDEDDRIYMAQSFAAAMQHAVSHAGELPILVTGSFYTVASAKQWLNKQ